MATLSKADKANLTASQQKEILNLKNEYEAKKAAGADGATLQKINDAANEIRASAGYSGGKTGNDYTVLPSNVSGGKSADQIGAEVAAFTAKNYNQDRGWINGYSTDMNLRSLANVVRQQMDANSKAWHTATEEEKTYLHEQNEKLAAMLPVESTYDPVTGKWSTWDPNLGYGSNAQLTQANIANAGKNYFGYTDEERAKWDADTDRYYNFVDVLAPARNTIDESSGYTGRYAQFVNGPYGQIFGTGTRGRANGGLETYVDVIGDGFGSEGVFYAVPQYDENGNIIKTAPALKNNSSLSAYQAQFAPQVVNGVIQSNLKGAKVNPMDRSSGNNNISGQRSYYENYGKNSGLRIGSQGGFGSVGGYSDYLQQIYAQALAAQLKALESGYVQNISQIDADRDQIDAAYTEQRRQTSGQAAQDAAAFREMANAYGLNSGAVGQASLSQRNQLQNDLNRLNAAQAAAQTELQRQRLLLGQQYQLAIEQAVAENNSSLAKNLYQEAVRAEEALQQQEQFYADLALQYSKAMMNFAKSTDVSGGTRLDVIEQAVKNGYISDAQGMALAEQLGYL